MFERSYAFSDMAIIQKENICKSRLDVKIESEVMGGVTRPLPIISANMSTVTDANFAIKMYQLGAMGVLHRAFQDIEKYILETKKIADKIPVVAVSVGIKDSDYTLVKRLVDSGANIVFVDVAHGFSKYVLKMCEYIRKFYPTVKIVAGNTVNSDMVKMFDGYIDAIKVGIGGGKSCATADIVGCTKNQFSAVYDMKVVSQEYNVPIISDGNIRCPADFTKAIGAGASAVMAGSIFARCPESAAEMIEIDGIKKKILAGMASEYIQNKWKGGLKDGTVAEGRMVHLDMGESIENLLIRYAGALRSAVTYAGFDNINDFKKSCKFILI